MSPEEIQEKLHSLEQQIIDSYKNASILDDVCTLEPVERNYQYGQFHQFANRYKIEKAHILDHSHFLIVNELGLEIARSEIALLIEEFTKQSISRKVEEFSMTEIRRAISDLKRQYFRPKPTVIFIPTEYFNEVFEWNKTQGLDFRDSWKYLALDHQTRIKVKFSSKYAKFDDIIITSEASNIWQYRPDELTNERLTARFHWEDYEYPMDAILEIKTIFNFKTTKEANMILKLPHREKPED